MTGHLDDAEDDQVSPIYSFSFGLSCIFLMGAMNKDVKPLAVRLDSGDLLSKFIHYLVMSKNSRKCYHGVPRVIANSFKN
jgi:alkylated DNA repair protein alkB family protein 1